jgi:hypothetical protein
VVPRAEALGYSLFALRAMAKCSNSKGVASRTPPELEDGLAGS